MRRLRLIAVTCPGEVAGEARAIGRLLGSGGLWRVHVRKPQWDAARLSALVEDIAPQYRPFISLHDHHGLAAALGVGGIHLNGRNPEVPAGWRGTVSRSCHSLAEVAVSPADYCFLSPVFDSISKPGYAAAFTAEALADARGTLAANVFALGGVTPARLPEVEALGFAGAAMLGAVWNDVDAFIAKIREYDTLATH